MGEIIARNMLRCLKLLIILLLLHLVGRLYYCNNQLHLHIDDQFKDFCRYTDCKPEGTKKPKLNVSYLYNLDQNCTFYKPITTHRSLPMAFCN